MNRYCVFIANEIAGPSTVPPAQELVIRTQSQGKKDGKTEEKREDEAEGSKDAAVRWKMSPTS